MKRTPAPYRIQSVGKKPMGNNTMTPFHCAAINPNIKYLKELLSAKSEDRIPDSIKRQPIHYAAACTGPDPLKVPFTFLIESGHTDRWECEPSITYTVLAGAWY